MVEQKIIAKEGKFFKISGEFVEKSGKKPFQKIVSAFNENFAAEKVLATIGSKHGISRRNIFLKEIKEDKGD